MRFATVLLAFATARLPARSTLVFAPPEEQRRPWRRKKKFTGARSQDKRAAALPMINTKLALEIPTQKAIADLRGDFGTGGSQRSAFRFAA